MRRRNSKTRQRSIDLHSKEYLGLHIDNPLMLELYVSL